jgi:hypothetical protein
VDKWIARGKGIAFEGTRAYVDSVLELRDVYGRAYSRELGLD